MKPFLPDHVGQVSSGGGFRRRTAGGPRCKCQPLLKTLSPPPSLSLSQENCPRIRRQFSPPSGPDTSVTGQACSLLHHPRSNTSPKGRRNITVLHTHCVSSKTNTLRPANNGPKCARTQIRFSLRFVRYVRVQWGLHTGLQRKSRWSPFPKH